MSEQYINYAHINRSYFHFGHDLILGIRTDLSGQKNAVFVGEFQTLKKGTEIPREAAIPLDEQGCQQLIDQLWNTGYRPTYARAGDAQIAAIKGHLKDMRLIAFKKLGMEL